MDEINVTFSQKSLNKRHLLGNLAVDKRITLK
jgi:hypothetical protein